MNDTPTDGHALSEHDPRPAASAVCDAVAVDWAALPAEIAGSMSGFRRTAWAAPQNTAEVSRWEAPDGRTAVLKVGRRLGPERDRLEWLAGRLAVPRVLGFAGSDAADFLLMTELPGRPGHDPAVLARPDRLVDDLAAVLRLVHAVPTAGCPFDARTGTLLAVAEQRASELRAEDLAGRYLSRSPVDLLADLTALRPAEEDLVFTHGDASVVNFLFGGSTTGTVDCGLAGVGDRYRDLAVAARSIGHNVGGMWVPRFFASYGADHDRRRVEFFMLLDEFVMARPD